MRRIISFVLVMLAIAANAQPEIVQPLPLEICDDNGDGLGVFDLTVAEVQMLNGLNPSLYSVAFYETVIDAEANVNSVTSIGNYATISPNQQTVYIRVWENANVSNFAITQVDLFVYELPEANQPINLVQYYQGTFDNALFNLNSQLSGVNSSPSHSFRFFQTLTDAQNAVNEITQTVAYANVTNPETIWIRVEQGNTPCVSYTSFELIVINAVEPIIYIPDAALKAKLVSNALINTNGDSEIQMGEANAVTVLNVTNATSMDASDDIYSIAGLEQFANLSTLIISNNPLGSLNVSGFGNLKNLSCVNCSLTTLLFAGTPLETLNCAQNNLPSIDLTTLPNLRQFIGQENETTSLLVAGLSQLEELNCPTNALSNLDLTGLPALKILIVQDNLLNGITVTGSPLVQRIQIANNPIGTLDVSGLESLQILMCQNANLTSLDISSNSGLVLLDCSNNEISALDFSGNQGIVNINVSGNQLTAIDVSSNPQILSFWIYNNPIVTINMKNGYNTVLGFVADDLPNLQYICVDEGEMQTIVNYFANEDIYPSINTYCNFAPGGDYNTISGIVKFDVDSNGCSNDLPFPYIKVMLTDGTDQYATYTTVSGSYDFYTEAGDFTVSPELESNGFTLSPASATVNFANDQNNISVADFCISPNEINPDLEVVVSPIGAPIPGYDTTYQVTLRNKGNQIMSQPLGLSCTYNDYQMDYVSTNPPADMYNNGIIYWNYTDLMPFETRTFLCTMTIHEPTDDYPVNLGDVIQVSAGVPSTGDALPADNSFVLEQMAINSLDPNDILCLEGDNQPTSAIGEYLHYRVRFENTGTAPAQNVVVRIPLNPAQYQVNSLQLLSASHPVIGRVHNNMAEFVFENLNLDSGGHGNVLLKVRSSDVLQQGQSALNRAGIFFDYNYPVETNDAETVFEDLSVADNPGITVAIYPNPVHEKLQFKTVAVIERIEIFDIAGRLIEAKTTNPDQTEFDATNLKPNLYFIKIYTSQGSRTLKFIKE